MEKKLYRSNTDKKLCGVCAGIGEFFGVDPTIIRLAWVFITLCAGVGILAYIISALVIPNKPE